MQARAVGALCCAGAMTILGSSFVVSRQVLAFPIMTGQAIRYAVAAAVLAPLAVLRVPTVRWPDRVALLRLAALAATGLVGFNICLLTALRHAEPAAIGTVVGVSPLILAIAGPLLAGVRPSARLIVAAVLVVSGVAVVEGGGRTDGVGLLLSVGALAGESLFSLLAVGLLDRYGPLGVSAWTCVLAVPGLAVGAMATGEVGRLRVPTAGEAAALAYLGLVLTVVAFLAWYAGLHRLGAARAGMFLGLLPATALGTAALVDGAVPAARQVVGVLVAGAALSWAVGGGRAAEGQRSAGAAEGQRSAGAAEGQRSAGAAVGQRSAGAAVLARGVSRGASSVASSTF